MPSQNWFESAPATLLAVELNYFRVPRRQWEQMLFRLRQIGANTISTSVFWGWHELAEGKFDVTGQTAPERDLVTFIQLVRAMGFWLILKPGPFIDGDIVGGGIPAWLLAKIPEAHARRYDHAPWQLNPADQPRLSLLHPQTLEHTQRWYTAFSQATLPYQWPQGPVIALQVDHETPGAGMISAVGQEQNSDARFRGDYNAYVTQSLWPQWLEARHGSPAAMASAYGQGESNFTELRFPQEWAEPRHIGDLRYWMDAARFTDWTYSQAVRVYSRALRNLGWQVPLFATLPALPWKPAGLAMNLGSQATAAGWVGQNVRLPARPGAALTDGGQQMGFEEYVQQAYWQARLVHNYNPAFPGYISHIPSQDDFSFQYMFIGGSQAVNLQASVQSASEPAGIGPFLSWGMGAPVRPDGSLRRRFWQVAVLYNFLRAGGQEFTLSRSSADILLGYSHVPELVGQWFSRMSDLASEPEASPISLDATIQSALAGAHQGALSQTLAQEMVRRQIDFDVIDIDFVAPDKLNPEKLLILPASGIMARRTQQRLAEFLQGGGRLVWVGGDLPSMDETLMPCDELQKSGAPAEQLWVVPNLPPKWPERLVQLGYLPRYAWSDASEGIDITVRYGPGQMIFLAIANRMQETYEGSLYFLDASRQIQTIRVRLGGPHMAFLSLREGKLESALLSGSDGAYAQLAGDRFAIDRGQAVIARFGQSLLVSSADPVRVELRQTGSWAGFTTWLALLDGRVVPGQAKVTPDQLILDYPVEVGGKETLLVLIGQRDVEITPELFAYFDGCRAFYQRLLAIAGTQIRELESRLSSLQSSTVQSLQSNLPSAGQALLKAAVLLEPSNRGSLTLESYIARLDQALRGIEQPLLVLTNSLAQARSGLASGLWPGEFKWVERELTDILEILGKLG